MVVNAVVAIGLSFFIGWIAAAIGTTLAGWAMVVALARGARPMGDVARFDARFRARIWRILIASAVMGAVLWGAMVLLTPMFALPGWRWGALVALVGAGLVSYFGTGQVIGAFRLHEFRAALRR